MARFGRVITAMVTPFTEDGALWGVVSTTGTGVSIYPALERLNLLWILDSTR